MNDKTTTPGMPAMVIDSGRRHQIFPTLSQNQFERLSLYGERRCVAPGEILYRQGERHCPMFVVISGHVEISRNSALGSKVIGIHGPGAFSGEVGTLAG